MTYNSRAPAGAGALGIVMVTEYLNQWSLPRG